MVGLFLVFLSAYLYKKGDDAEFIPLKALSAFIALLMTFFIINYYTDVKSSPNSETVMIVNEDGTVTEENGYYVDDDGNYYIRTDDWKKTILLAPFEKMKFEKVNPPIFDTDNLVSEEINNKEK